jgi:hypothetical protein
MWLRQKVRLILQYPELATLFEQFFQGTRGRAFVVPL